MFTFSSKTIIESIKRIKSVGHLGRSQGNINSLPAYLLLRWLGCSDSQWLTKEEVYSSTDADPTQKIFELGAVLDTNEYAEKGGCVFFSSFSNAQNNQFNPGSKFDLLFLRFKDTVDNSIAEILFDRGSGSKYRIKLKARELVRGAYDKRFPLMPVICWIYRFHPFQEKPSASFLKSHFQHDYKLSDDDVREIFDTNHTFQISSGTEITGEQIRNELGLEIGNVVKRLNSDSSVSEKRRQMIPIIEGEGKMNKKKLVELLWSQNQVILTGVPGTGKSYLVNEIESEFENVTKVQFHPSYSYQDFVLMKTLEDGNVIDKPGPLIEVMRTAKNDVDKEYLLVIDEINRGNTASIFGELLYLLDRGNSLRISINGSDFECLLPRNLKIIGTMNSADRSIALIDYALRRRFAFVELEPDYDLIDRQSDLVGLEETDISEGVSLGNFLRKLNKNIVKTTSNEDFRLGHSFFLKAIKEWSTDELADVIQYKINPMIKEYTHANPRQSQEILPVAIIRASRSEDLIRELKVYINGDD